MSKATHAMRRLAVVLFAASALASCSSETSGPEDAGHAASSSAGLPNGRPAHGEQLAQAKGRATGQSCIDCHGADGNEPIDATYPRLGGQYPDYLAHALQAYRSQDRQHALMTPQAADLSDQDIADLAAYFGSRPGQLRDLHGVN